MGRNIIYQYNFFYICIDKINRKNTMTLQQLRYIVAIDEYRHFGKAAEATGLTQSTLSLMLKKMEEELDVRIFDRESHPVEPTKIGRKIIDRAKVVLYNVEQIAEMTRSEKETLSGPLKIALISTVASVLVPGLFKYLGEKCPSITLQTEEMLTSTIKDKLKKAEVDMGILAGPVPDADLLEIPLYHESFLAYVSADNPAFAQESIRMDTLLKQPVWIIRDGLRLMDPAEMKEGKITYERFFEGGRVGILIQIVNDNGGITIVPETHTNLIMYSQQNCLRPIIDPVPRRTISLVVRSDYIHEAKLNAVVDAVKHIIPGTLLENVIRKGRLKL
jgi:LysR family hydrogen peroxide-inducible transcriptional activator